MKILEAEIELREDTRVAEQARSAVDEDDHRKEAAALADRQEKLRVRCEDLTQRIRSLPNGENFPKEIALLTAVAEVMQDATGILSEHDTGSAAIAAETEAIELLLQSKRINPKGGGGGGTSPGGGGTGTTSDAAIALLGKGKNEQEVRVDRNVNQATGRSQAALPEEFRAGLDEYFNRILQPQG